MKIEDIILVLLIAAIMWLVALHTLYILKYIV